MSNFPNLDFSFRRGTKLGLLNTPIENGSFNICKDTKELYIDIDNGRYAITSIIKDYTEEEIFGLQSYSNNTIYISNDTNCGYVYNEVLGTFMKIFDNVEHATLDDIYRLDDKINSLIGFSQKIVESISDLPETGEAGAIYFVKKEKSEEKNLYDEYIWVEDINTGEGKYELIGITNIDLSGYYSKSEVDKLLSNHYTKEEVNNLLESLKSSINTTIDSKTSNISENLEKTYLEASLVDESDDDF